MSRTLGWAPRVSEIPHTSSAFTCGKSSASCKSPCWRIAERKLSDPANPRSHSDALRDLYGWGVGPDSEHSVLQASSCGRAGKKTLMSRSRVLSSPTSDVARAKDGRPSWHASARTGMVKRREPRGEIGTIPPVNRPADRGERTRGRSKCAHTAVGMVSRAHGGISPGILGQD